jgi:hypothetical protein
MVLQPALVMKMVSSLVPRTRLITLSRLERPRTNHRFQVCAKVSFRLGFLNGKDSTDRNGVVVKVGRKDGTWIATGVQAKDIKILASKATPDVNIVRKWYAQS